MTIGRNFVSPGAKQSNFGVVDLEGHITGLDEWSIVDENVFVVRPSFNEDSSDFAVDAEVLVFKAGRVEQSVNVIKIF